MTTTATIPHPPRRVPILGDVLGMDRKRPNQKTLQQFGRLGPLYRRSFVGGVHLTFAGSAALMQELRDEDTWARYAARPYEQLVPIGGQGLFTAPNDSPQWQRAHEILMPGFARTAMSGYHETMLRVIDQAEQWIGEEREVTDVAAMMGDAALETISLAGFGHPCGVFTSDAERAPFAAALTRAFAYVQESAIPVLGGLTGGKRARQHTADIALMKSTVLEVIAARRRSGIRQPDLLDRMLHPESGAALPDDNIADQVLTFLIAGHETTGNLMAFASYFLAADPDLAEQVRSEVKTLTSGGRIDFDDVAKLRFTDAVISESLRLWPTAPGFFRVARRDTTLGGYPIRAGEWVFALMLAVHRDQEVWGPDADQFRPHRFLGDTKPVPPGAYRPFGTGPRSCIGQAFARHEARLMLASLVRDFELTTTTSKLDVEENLTLRPSGLAITYRRI
ncbi:cytochrome P450 (plasmid) [Nocardia sp. NBC_01377]|uniref:cytochrome P450 n=1 Tax=Nocardia sp. NBC_01377 TaxID=2903595 RepID=UPI002F91611C